MKITDKHRLDWIDAQTPKRDHATRLMLLISAKQNAREAIDSAIRAERRRK